MFTLPDWRRLFRLPSPTPDSAADDVDAELAFHLEMRVAELTALGMPDAEARAEAMRRFGDLAAARSALHREGAGRARRIRRLGWIADLADDLRFALRGLRRRAGFSAVAVGTIGLGLGLTTTVLAVVNRLVLHPLPYPGAERLGLVYMAMPQSGMQVSPTLLMLEAWQRHPAGLDWIEAYDQEALLLENGGTAELVPTRAATPRLLTELGARIALGRGFLAADAMAGAAPVTVLGWGTWQRRFGGRAAVIGETVRLDGMLRTVVGVMARGFDLTPIDNQPRAEFWLPLGVGIAGAGRSAAILARRNPDATPEQAGAALAATLTAANAQGDLPARFRPTLVNPARFLGDSRARTLWLLTLAVSLLLGVACANVAALLLGQAAARAREFGVRAALGAGRGRVARQLATEAGALVLAGGALGLAVAELALGLTRLARPANLLAVDDARLEPRVLVMALLVTLGVALLAGAAPAWAASRGDAAATLVGRVRRSIDSRFGRSLRGALVAGQLAVSLVLLSGAGLLLRGFLRERNLPVGFTPEGLGWVTTRVSERDVPSPAVRDALADAALARVAAIPGITAVASSGDGPLGYGILEGEFLVEGRELPAETGKILMPLRAVGPGYFRVIGTPVTLGRPLDTRAGSTEIMIDETSAARLFPRGDAVGRRVRFDRKSADWKTIVGLVPEQRALTGGFTDAPIVYQPIYPGDRGRTLLVRWPAGAPSPLERVSAVIRGVDSRIRIRTIEPAEAMLAERLGARRFTMNIVTGFAALALLLAAVGLYGVVALAVNQRRYEIGVRMALGAAPGAVRLMVLREGAHRIGLGLGLGFLLVAGLGRLLRSLLPGITLRDPAVWLGAALALGGAGLLACWLPARRASRVDPLIALRADS